MEKIRIQKYLSDCGIMSRRAAEKEIEAGNVSVNGIPASIGMKIDPDSDIIKYCGKVITIPKSSMKYIMLNKPCGYVTTVSDEQGRKCVIDLVKNIDTRLYPIGRLDMYSEGLLLLTNDGDLTNKLTHPRHKIPKIYDVKISGEIDNQTLAFLNSSMDIDGYTILPVKTEIVSENKDFTVLRMTLFEGRNRQIRKMCALAGKKVLALRRIAIGDITLGSLPQGKWRELSPEEVKYLKE